MNVADTLWSIFWLIVLGIFIVGACVPRHFTYEIDGKKHEFNWSMSDPKKDNSIPANHN
jgi:hypothetical protein